MHSRFAPRVSRTALFASAVVAVYLAEPALALAQAEHTEAVVAPPEESTDQTDFTISLGATLNYGNSRSFQAAASTHFLIFRDIHQFTLDFATTLGLAAARETDPVTGERNFTDLVENSRNILGRMRYDLWLDPDDALFAAVVGRHDPFAGLDFRFQGQLGYMRNLFRETDHRFWGEVGFDVTVDDRYPNPLPNPAAMPGMCGGVDQPPCFLSDIDDQYSVRVYLGYDNHLNDTWSLVTGVEALFDVVNGENIRLSSISEFRLTIDANLQASLRFTLLFDNTPVPGNDPVDTTTVLTLVYTAF